MLLPKMIICCYGSFCLLMKHAATAMCSLIVRTRFVVVIRMGGNGTIATSQMGMLAIFPLYIQLKRDVA
jgi:hypothetical protein